MAQQSFLAKNGLRSGTLGTSAALAYAFPLAEANYDPAAGTDATRIGWYADRTGGAEKIGAVIMGTERLSVTAVGATVTGVLTATGQIVGTANGAASTSAEKLTGTWFTGGSATTTKPQLLIEPTGTTSTGWSTNGTGIGVNATAGFTGNLLDLQVNGVSVFAVPASGAIVASIAWNSLTAPTNNLAIAMANFTTAFTWNTATTGTQWAQSSTSLSSGTLASFNVASTAATANTQTVLSVATSGANGTATQTTFGATFANTHTGTTSTNVAASFSASGGTNNYALLATNGRVGFSTSTPVASFENAFTGAASTPASLISGTWFTGGSATTTKPQLLIEPTGTTTTNWSTSGTGLGLNAATAFAGNLIDAQRNAVSKFSVTATGVLSTASSAFIGTSGTTDGLVAWLSSNTTNVHEFRWVIDPGTPGYCLFDITLGSNIMIVDNGGRFDIGSTAPNTAWMLRVEGDQALMNTNTAGTVKLAFSEANSSAAPFSIQRSGSTSGSANIVDFSILANASMRFTTNSSIRTTLTGSGTWQVNTNGAASVPASSIVGTWFTGGSATTTKPQFLVEPTGTTSTNWSTNGTGIGVNATAGFTGNLLDLQINGVRVFAVGPGGITTGSLWSSLTAPTANLTLAMANFTTAMTWNTATTGTQWDMSSSSLSSGTLVNLAVTGTAAAANTQTVFSIAASGANAGATQTTTGTSISNTHTGTTSTNVGITVSASGGTNNYALLVTAGRMGFSTSTPVAGFENAFNAAASTPAKLVSGTWFTGGSSTTTKPQVLIEPTATTSTGWSTNGTGLGINAASGFTGNLFDAQLNGVSVGALTSAGVMTIGANAGAGTSMIINGAAATQRALIYETAGSVRWNVRAGNAAESGANAGSNYIINAFDDSGVTIDNPIVITRAAAGVITFVRPVVNSFTGLASTPAELLSGSWFTGGSATTTKPQLLVEPTGTTTNNWSTSGTGIGVNAAAAFAGNLLDLQINGVRVFAVGSGGITTGTVWSSITAPTASLTTAMANFTTTFTWNTATTGTQWTMSSSSLSSGTLEALTVTGTAAAGNTQTVQAISTSGANGTTTQTTFGTTISNTHTGTSSTNIALQLTASGGTNNYAMVVTAGDVGLGTSTPTAFMENANNGALSKSGALFSGTWITGGSATTNKPYVSIETAGATSTNWGTTGTALGINSASGFTGNFLDTQLNGVRRQRMDATGNFLMSGGGVTGSTTSLQFTMSNGFESATGGSIALLQLNTGAAIGGGDKRLGGVFFGGTTAAGVVTNSAGVSGVSEANFSSTSAPTYILYETTPSASVTRVERARMPSGGGMLIGTSGAINAGLSSIAGSFPALLVQATQTTTFGMSNVAVGANTAGATEAFFKTRTATGAATTIIVSGDAIATITGYGADGVVYQPSAQIKMTCAAAPSANVMPGNIIFSVNRSTNVLSESARFSQTGEFLLGTTAETSIGGAGSMHIGGVLETDTTVGIYGTSVSNVMLRLGTANAISNPTQSGINQQWAATSSATSMAYGNASAITTAAAAFTCPEVHNYQGNAAVSAGAGSTITRYFNFSSIQGTPGTNNYGFVHTATPTTADTGNWAFLNTTTDPSKFNGPLTLSGAASNLTLSTAGSGILVKTGTNATFGTAVLIGGTVTVSTTKVTASSVILLTSQVDGGTPASVRISARSAGTSFTITSLSVADISTIGWLIIEPS